MEESIKEQIGKGKEIFKNETEPKLPQAPFVKYNLDEEGKKQDTFTLWLNKEDRIMLEEGKKLLQQSKDSTAIKTLAHIGAKTIGSKDVAYILEQVNANKRKNKRINIVDFE